MTHPALSGNRYVLPNSIKWTALRILQMSACSTRLLQLYICISDAIRVVVHCGGEKNLRWEGPPILQNRGTPESCTFISRPFLTNSQLKIQSLSLTYIFDELVWNGFVEIGETIMVIR